SNAPLLGSTAAEGLPRIGRTSIATRWRSCGLPQSASCCENFVIPPDVFGQTLRIPQRKNVFSVGMFPRTGRSFPLACGSGGRGSKDASSVRRGAYLRAGVLAGWTHAEKMGKHDEVHAHLLLEAGHQSARRGNRAI